MADLITRSELITLTNFSLSGDYSDEFLDGKIEVVSEHVTAYCLGTLFSPETITDERSGSYVQGRSGRLTIKLKYAPLISVTSLKYRIGSTETTMSITNVDTDKVNSYLYLGWYGPLWRMHEKWITVTNYMAGHTEVPTLVKNATALLVREAIDADDQANEGSGGVLASWKLGNYSEAYSTVAAEIGNLGLGTKRSILATQYLKRYRRAGVM